MGGGGGGGCGGVSVRGVARANLGSDAMVYRCGEDESERVEGDFPIRLSGLLLRGISRCSSISCV